jgi:hypothetical protein
VQPAGAVTTAGGATTHPVIATVYFTEPNITNAGGDTITVAATVYIADEPTEGASNYGLAIAAGVAIIADDKDLVFGAGEDVKMRWSTADADNHAFAIGLGASRALHIAEVADIATDWNVAADTHPKLYVHSSTTPATDYVEIYHDANYGYINAAGGGLSLRSGGTERLRLEAATVNIVDMVLYGSTAAHTGDTADGSLYLRSTSNATKGWVAIANAELGLIIGSDGSVDRATTVGTNALHLFNGTAPAGTLANGVSLYSEGGEMKAMDALGNVTVLSPHTPDGDFVIHSYSAEKDETITVHLEKLLKALATTPALSRFVKMQTGHVKAPVNL